MLFRVKIFRLNLKKNHQISKILSPKYKILAEICQKNVFYALLFVLRVGDSWKIWESWHRCILVCGIALDIERTLPNTDLSRDFMELVVVDVSLGGSWRGR